MVNLLSNHDGIMERWNNGIMGKQTKNGEIDAGLDGLHPSFQFSIIPSFHYSSLLFLFE